tara:strand:+ start:344 stop:1687 length:1344 start_codon:yes stop_codon:yes gene_type:complete
MREKCGVFGINSSKLFNTELIIKGLSDLQHRGQEGCGISYYEDRVIVDKNLGLVKDVFSNYHNKSITNGIGHVRYSTSGKSKLDKQEAINECQPLNGVIINEDSKEEFSIVHNGNIPKVTSHDTSFIKTLLEKSDTWLNKLTYLIENIPCAYSIIILTKLGMYVLRDRYGIRPLSIGENNSNNSIGVSSETVALKNFTNIRSVKPGEIIYIENGIYNTIYQSKNIQYSLCALELVYFLRPESNIDGYNVTSVREEFGTRLAMTEYNSIELNKNKNYIVVGIPETGKISARAYAKMMGFKYEQLIEKNKDIERTFIMPDNCQRQSLCRKKFIYNNINNKNIIVVDDSLVRGNVMKSIISCLKEYGAKEIHIRITSPPIINKCRLGIDITSTEELLAFEKDNSLIKIILEVDSIKYLDNKDFDNILPEFSYKECFGYKVDDNMFDWDIS